MKCPKCDYTSFDYLGECKKCGEILDDCRQSLNLKMIEPTLFANIKENTSEDLSANSKSTPEDSRSSHSDPDFLPAAPPPPPENQSIDVEPSDLRIAEEPLAAAGLGSLGDMSNMQVRPKGPSLTENLSKIELDLSADEVSGLELTPSFNADDHDLPPTLSSGESDRENEFSLFEDNNNEQNDLGELIDDNVPFEFTTNDLGSDTQENSNKTDNDLIELELDMDDEESLDQILADLRTDK